MTGPATVTFSGPFNGVAYVEISKDNGSTWNPSTLVITGAVFPASSNYDMKASELLRIRVQKVVSGALLYTLTPPQPDGTIDLPSINISGATITSGYGVPNSVQPNGSLYMRQDGLPSARLYISEGGGVWAPVGSS